MTWFRAQIRRIIEDAAERAIKDALSPDKIDAGVERAIYRGLKRVCDAAPDDAILTPTGFRIFLALEIRRQWPDYPEKSLRADVAMLTEGMDDSGGWDMSAGAARDLAREHLAEYSE